MFETPAKCHLHVLAGLLALALLPVGARADETEGRWDGPFCWPVVGTHMIHLHTGKIMIWPGHYTESDEIEVWLWEPKPGCFGDNPRDNPDGNCFTRADNDETNLFCPIAGTNQVQRLLRILQNASAFRVTSNLIAGCLVVLKGDGQPRLQIKSQSVDGALRGTKTMQYQLEQSSDRTLVITATAIVPNLTRMLGEFEAMVASIRLD